MLLQIPDSYTRRVTTTHVARNDGGSTLTDRFGLLVVTVPLDSESACRPLQSRSIRARPPYDPRRLWLWAALMAVAPANVWDSTEIRFLYLHRN
jgi:hypothetical protein